MNDGARGDLRLGTSGWTYASWKGTVYPEGVGDRVRLEYYAEHLFDTVELNASYYRWPGLTTFEGWHRRLPDGFRMTVKAPKGLTHVGRLATLDEWLPRITPALDALGDRLGLFLAQLPPTLQRDDALLDAFLTAMPSRFDIAVEFRHDSWLHDDVFALLDRHDAAYVVMDGPTPKTHTDDVRVTSSSVYIRFHGPKGAKLYGGSYSDEALGTWAERIDAWLVEGRTVWAYFNNDIDGAAVANAQTLGRLVRERA